MHPLVPARYRVASRVVEADRTVTLVLDPVDAPIPAPRPGQFTMLYAFGVGEVPVSVSGVPEDGGSLRHTIRAVGATTEALCALDPGAQVGVRGPFGTAWGVEDLAGMDVVVVAGGLGLASLRPAVRYLLARPPGGTVSVLIGSRTPVDLLYAAELGEWRRRDDVHTAVTVDVARPGWDGEVGFVTDLFPGAPFRPDRTVALVCGPEVMMRVAARALVGRGIPAARVRVSLERNMRCAIVRCGHCQLGPLFVCADGPVLDYATVGGLLDVRRL
jgi:anaerobic sulfite reductase subunit B